jgi:hypothetical protein
VKFLQRRNHNVPLSGSCEQLIIYFCLCFCVRVTFIFSHKPGSNTPTHPQTPCRHCSWQVNVIISAIMADQILTPLLLNFPVCITQKSCGTCMRSPQGTLGYSNLITWTNQISQPLQINTDLQQSENKPGEISPLISRQITSALGKDELPAPPMMTKPEASSILQCTSQYRNKQAR